MRSLRWLTVQKTFSFEIQNCRESEKIREHTHIPSPGLRLKGTERSLECPAWVGQNKSKMTRVFLARKWKL